MVPNLFDNDSSNALLSRDDAHQGAEIFRGNTQRPFAIQSVTIALDTKTGSGPAFGSNAAWSGGANPFKIGFPFKSVIAIAATDTSTFIALSPDSPDSYQSGVPLQLKDSVVLNKAVSSAFLSWPAQSGKTITLVFLVDSEFRSGQTVSVTGGGVSISEGSSFVNAQVALTAATATVIFASNSSRKVSTFQNTTGASVWVGGSAITNSGSTIGIEVLPGQMFQWKNSAALYGYSVPGGNVSTLEET